ncbi:hypothetical protein N7517_006313 [Penicillium concentricum]|uniref:NWD NACHT-NTPase N-terminal domain-containing protein n=1 Tax=Penicillium concentricum TaxID=293559 RepID=A0A9W9VA06_9EURO|nr:uncharacterized protein N7517_006313 [Penicillium concentricum]KAJ5374307.1 hypothetical protein N7517_006313 [Penicillium concentricum]
MDEWEEALNGLSSKLKTCLLRAREEKADVLTVLLQEAESKKTLGLQKRWKINLRGKTIVLRDLFDKIIAWVYKFKAIGDTAVQFDPAPASLAWAGVQFLLQVCMADSICFESTIHGLEVTSRMIARYAAFEPLYTKRTSGIQSQLKGRLNEELEKITQLDTEVEKLARISDAEVQLQIQDVIRRLSRIHSIMRGIRRRDSQDRQNWVETSTSSILLLHGIPGSGKTSLASSVMDSFLEHKSQNPLAAPLAYFYCGDSKVGRGWADPDEIMGCLTRQFAVIDRQNLEVHEHVLLEYQRKAAEAKLDGFDVPKLKVSQCVDLILGILGSNPVVLVVEGVDEIEET